MNRIHPPLSMLQNISKLTLFALPISAGALINMISNFVSMYFVAKLGTNELAAGALAVTTFITITMVAPIFYAISILISHSKGREYDVSAVGQLVKNGFWLAIILAIPAAIVLWNASKMLVLFGQDIELARLTQSYFHFAAFAMVPMLINNVITQFYTGIGHPRFTMKMAMISTPISIALSYSLILGKFGFPKLGLAGVTCAVFIVQFIFCIIMLTYLYFGNKVQKYKMFSGKFLPDLSLCKKIFFLGFPISLQFGGELAAMSVSTYFMGHFGANALAASQIVGQYALLIVMVSLGLSQALSILTSEAYGKNEFELIKQYVHAGVIVLSGLSTMVLAISILIPNYLTGFFINIHDPANQNIIHLAIIFFFLSAIFLFIDGIRNLFSGGLRGLHDSKAPMNIGIFCLWVISLPLCYFVAFTLGGGPIGLRLGFMVGFIVAVILLWKRIHHKINSITTLLPLDPHVAS